jgi:uncharacterized protein (TIGR00369 family)
MPFQPLDPAFAERVRRSFDRQTLLRTLGATLERVAPGEVDVALPCAPHLLQQHGFVHAGATISIVDVACGYAALTLMPPEAAVLTAELKVNLLAPAEGERLLARGRVLKPGRTLTVCQGDVFALRGGEEKHVATLLATMAVVTGRGFAD